MCPNEYVPCCKSVESGPVLAKVITHTYLCHAVSIFYGTESEILAGFGRVDSTENKFGPIKKTVFF